MNKVELLAPAGNYEAFLGAINAGADAVYLGGNKYGARAYADNFSEEEIISAIRYAHLFNRKVYLTINTLMKETEYEELCEYVKPLYINGLDGVIIQDLGAFFVLKKACPKLELHASTQMTLTGELGVSYLKEIGAHRVVPARELSLDEIKTIKENVDIEIECFVHGAMCYCYSGQCLFSSVLGGRSGNRGRCAQPCRLPYKYSKNGQESYPFSLKDMCTIEFVPKLIEAGIDSFKIEGRMKKPEYAAGVTAIYRKYIDMYYEMGKAGYKVSKKDLEKLSKLYIRSEIQDGYYYRHNGKEMITPGKPSYSGSDETYLNQIRQTYIEKSMKIPVDIYGEFLAGERAKITAIYEDITASFEGDVVDLAQNRPMSKAEIEKQIIKTGNTVFECQNVYLEVGDNVFVPNKVLNNLRRSILKALEDQIISQNGFDAIRDDMTDPEIISHEKKIPTIKKEMIVSVSTKEQLFCLKNNNYEIDKVYLDYKLLLDMDSTEIEEISKKWRLGVVYPRIVRKRALPVLEEIYQKASEFEIAIIKNIETLQFLRRKGYAGKIICDYTLYVSNVGSMQWANETVAGFCYPVELNKGELLQLKASDSLWKEQLVYSYLPLMVTANCLKKTNDRCGQKNDLETIFDRYQKMFVSKSNCKLCYSELYNCVPMSLHKYLKDMKHDVNAYRIDFTIEDSKKTSEVLNLYFANGSDLLIGEYTTGHFKRGVE